MNSENYYDVLEPNQEDNMVSSKIENNDTETHYFNPLIKINGGKINPFHSTEQLTPTVTSNCSVVDKAKPTDLTAFAPVDTNVVGNNLINRIIQQKNIQIPEVVTQPPTGFDKDERRMLMYELSKKLENLNMLRYHPNTGYYLYNGNYYSELDEDYLSNNISHWLRTSGIHPQTKDIKFIISQLRTNSFSINNEPNNPNVILYQNCMIDINTEQIFPISENYFATGAINANYNYNIINNHPYFSKFITDIANGDYILERRIWEFVAYTLTPDYNAKRLFILYGVGDGGKSLLLRVLEGLLTPSLVSNMSIKNLVSGRFAGSELMGKRIMLASDEGNWQISVQDTALLKKLTGGGENVTFDVKYKSQCSFKAVAKIIIATNSPIHATASAIDPAFRNRLMVIPFTHAIPKEKQDPYLKEKILNERDAIVTTAYHIYQSLRRNNYVFSGDGGGYDDTHTFVKGMQPCEALIDFVKSNCSFEEGCFTPTEVLYNAFLTYCPESPYKDITSFSQALSGIYGDKIESCRKRTEYGNNRGFIGIKTN